VRGSPSKVNQLNQPATLNVTLPSTNPIEDVMSKRREKTENVKRWNVAGNMLNRWAASGLLWTESGFRRLRPHKDLSHLRMNAGKLLATPILTRQ